jgi:hypothetical protein
MNDDNLVNLLNLALTIRTFFLFLDTGKYRRTYLTELLQQKEQQRGNHRQSLDAVGCSTPETFPEDLVYKFWTRALKERNTTTKS